MFFSPQEVQLTVFGALTDNDLIKLGDASTVATLVVWEPESQKQNIALQPFYAQNKGTLRQVAHDAELWQFQWIKTQGQLQVFRVNFAGAALFSRISHSNPAAVDSALYQSIAREQTIEVGLRVVGRDDPAATTCLDIALTYSIRKLPFMPHILPITRAI